MIKINPKDRPSCDQFLRMPEVQTKMKQLKMIRPDRDALREERRPSLLQTIKLPKNLKNLDKRLPKSQYDNVSNLAAPDSPQLKSPSTPPNGVKDDMIVKRKRRSVAPAKQHLSRDGEEPKLNVNSND